MKKAFRKIDKEDYMYQKDLRQKLKLKHKKHCEIVKEKAESEQSERINSESGLCSALDNDKSELNSCSTNSKQ